MSRLTIGIDPGCGGGICELWDGKEPVLHAMMDEPDLRDFFYSRGIAQDYATEVYLEQVGGYIGKPQPGSAMFNFGNGYGFIRGLLSANRIKTVLVRPQTWQKGIPGLQGVKGADRKRAMKEHASRLYPNSKITLKTADALLIADYGSKQP